jgi:hypothetical protein
MYTLSLATGDLAGAGSGDDSYRPRAAATGSAKRPPRSRITPRSAKHARELELNRKAAAKCRNRQKAHVDNLQARYRKEEERLRVQTSLVHSLHDEVIALRNELMRQSLCECHSLQGAATSLVSRGG